MNEYTYDLTTDIGLVRLLVPDNKADTYIFADGEITAFIVLERNNVRRAAALALETIASNEALVLKVIRLLDVQTDGAKVSDALLKRAATLRKQAFDEEELAAGDGFDIVTMVVDGHTWEQAVMAKELWGLY